MALNERTAIVTGAGKRLGAALSQALIDDGWTLIAHVHSADDTVPEGAVRCVAELDDPDCADRIFSLADGLPPVTLLINNAARFAWDGPSAFNSLEFDRHMAVNARAPALLTERLAQQHTTGGDALVVNVLDAKLSAPNPDFLSYTLAKSALAALTELHARAFADRGIRVNTVAPALMMQSPGQSRANFEAMHRHNPLGRGVEPHDVVEAIRYLLRAHCVTGQILTIDSGQRFMGLPRDVQFLGGGQQA